MLNRSFLIYFRQRKSSVRLFCMNEKKWTPLQFLNVDMIAYKSSLQLVFISTSRFDFSSRLPNPSQLEFLSLRSWMQTFTTWKSTMQEISSGSQMIELHASNVSFLGSSNAWYLSRSVKKSRDTILPDSEVNKIWGRVQYLSAKMIEQYFPFLCYSIKRWIKLLIWPPWF